MTAKPHISELCQQAKIVEVVGAFTDIRGEDTVKQCQCHRNDEHEMKIDEHKNEAVCYQCDVKGIESTYSPLRYLMEAQEMTFDEAITWLAKLYNVQILPQRKITSTKRTDMKSNPTTFHWMEPAVRVDHEQAVLSAIITQKWAMPHVYRWLSKKSFVGFAIDEWDYQRKVTLEIAQKHKMVPYSWIYATAVEMFKSGQAIDILSIQREVRRKWNINIAYQLSSISGKTLTEQHIVDHALAIVYDNFRLELVKILKEEIERLTSHGPTDGLDIDLKDIIGLIQRGFDPIKAAIKAHSFCMNYGMPQVAERLYEYSSLAETKLEQMRSQERNRQLVNHLMSSLGFSLYQSVAMNQLYAIATHLATNKNTDSEVLDGIANTHSLLQMNENMKVA